MLWQKPLVWCDGWNTIQCGLLGSSGGPGRGFEIDMETKRLKYMIKTTLFFEQGFVKLNSGGITMKKLILFAAIMNLLCKFSQCANKRYKCSFE